MKKKKHAKPERLTPMKGQQKSGPVPTPDFSFMREQIDSPCNHSDAMSLDEPRGREGPLATLPTEILSQICALLRQDHALYAMSSLRLTCRRFASIVNEYLFSTVYMNRRRDSLLRLRAIARSPLARFVQNIQVDAEPVFPEMDWTQWLMNVNSFGQWPVPSEDQWWGRGAYEEALGQERDSISSETELRGRWLLYQLELASQNRLDNLLTTALCINLSQAFKRLANIKTVEARAWMCSRYIIPDNTINSRRYVRSVFKRTLTLPCFRRTTGRPALGSTSHASPDHFQATYVAAILGAAMRYSLKVQNINTLGVSRRGLTKKLLAADEESINSSLANMWIAPICRVQHPREKTDDLLKLFARAPNLKKLTLGGLRAPHRPPKHPIGYNAIDLSSLDLPMARLEELALRDVFLPAQELRALFSRLPSSMKKVAISAVTISGGFWVDMFESMHNEHPRSYRILLAGPLMEGTTRRVTDLWAVWERADNHSLRSRVLDYVNQPEAAAPLRSTSKGGTSGEWRSASEKTMKYMRVGVEIPQFPWKTYFLRGPG